MTNTLLENLTEEERLAVAAILKEYGDTGSSSKLTDLLNEDWEEVPVDIDTFLHDKKYLGNGLIDAEGRFTIFPYWVNKLKEIFPTNTTTAYNTLIFTGAIGLGKSMIACICLLYMLYRLLCLRDPYLYYGMQPVDKLSISLMNITIENAKGVAMDKINQMILSSEWFLSHGEMRGTTNLEYIPDKHIELITASSNNQVIGRAILANFTDECLDGDTKVLTDDGVYKLKDIVGKEKRFITYSGNNLELSEPCVVKPTKITNEEYIITLENGEVIRCTYNHKLLLTSGEYKQACDLTESDELADIMLDDKIFSVDKVVII